MSSNNFYVTNLNDEGFIRGPARLLYAVVTQTFPTQISAVVNLTTYAAMAGWSDLGATKTGVQITVNNSEENFDVDQILGDIETLPTNWETSVATALAETTLDRLQFAWEGDPVTTAVKDGGNEKTMGFGTPLAYTKRRLAVAYVRSTGKIRMFVFRKVQRSPQESTLTYNKTGEQQSVPVRFKALPDLSIANILQRYFMIFDQV